MVETHSKCTRVSCMSISARGRTKRLMDESKRTIWEGEREVLGGRGKEGQGLAGWKSRNRLKERGNGVETAFPKDVLPQTRARGVPTDAYFIRVAPAFNRDLNPRAATKRRPCARPSTLLPRFGWRPGVGLNISALCALFDAGRLSRCLIEQRGTRLRCDEPGWQRPMAICTRTAKNLQFGKTPFPSQFWSPS